MARRPRGRRGGGSSSPVPLIIFVVLFVFSFAGFVMMWREMHDLRDQIYGSFDPAQHRDIKFKRFENKPTIGYKYLLAKKEDQLRDKISEYETLAEFAGIETSEIDDQRAKIEGKREAMGVQIGPNDQTRLTLYITRLETRITQLQQDLKLAREEQDNLREKYAQAISTKKSDVSAKDQTIQSLRGELSQRDETIASETSMRDEEISELRSKISKTAEEHLVEIEEKNKRISGLKKSLAEKQKQVEELLERGAGGGQFDVQIAEIDGKVLVVDLDERTAMLDIGRVDGAQKGLLFDVYEVGVGGKRRKKGEVEIKRVYGDVSYAGITSMVDPLDPILQDNILISPAFERGRPMVFVIEKNDFDKTDIAVLKNKLGRFGNKLVTTPDLNVRYCIIGTRPSKGKRPIAEECERLGIPMLKVSDLEHVLGDD